MALLQVPTPPTGILSYECIVPLEGTEYQLAFTWEWPVNRENRWYMNLADQDANPIASGIGLLVGDGVSYNFNLLRRFKDPRLPPGLLYCTDTSLQATDCLVAGDLGTRVLLMYLTSDDPNFQAYYNAGPE